MNIDSVQQAEERLRQAMQSSDLNALTDLLDEDLIFTAFDGRVLSRDDDLQMHSSGDLVFESLSLSNQAIRLVEGVAIVSVTAHIEATFCGNRADGVFQFTRVWATQNGHVCRVVAGHVCRVTAE